MSKFSGVLSFAEKHPFISLMALSTVVSGVVNFTKALMSPFTKTPACQINFGDLAKTLADQVKKPEAEEPGEEEEEVVEINPGPVLVETE